MSLSRHRMMRSRLYSVVSLLLLCALAACGGGNQQTSATPTPSHALVTFDLGIPQQALNAPVAGNVADDTQLHVLVSLKVNQALLNQLGGQQQNASDQGTDLTAVANQLGITDQQYQQIKQFFGLQDLSINLNSLHTILTLDGKASTFASLLKTSFVVHQYQGRKFFAPAKPLMLPQFVAEHVQAISGLDSYTPPVRSGLTTNSLHALNVGAQRDSCVNAASNGFLTTQQIRQAYSFNQAASQGKGGSETTILLPELAAFPQSDVQHYLDCVGFHGKLSVVTVNNNPPQPDVNTDVEVALDVEMVAGLLPNANIVIYQEANGGFGSLSGDPLLDIFNQIQTDYARHRGPVDLSLSWGGPENLSTRSDVSAVDSAVQTLVQGEHINFLAASGDCAAYDISSNYPNTLSLNFPASDSYSISVGGTVLSTNAAGNRTQEAVWSSDPTQDLNCDNTWGSGGGLSQYFQQPAWQQGPGVQNKYSNGKRQAPDISAIADNIVFFYGNNWVAGGGTSAATPIWTSALALANEGLITKTHYYTFGPALFYWIAQHAANDHPYYDVTKGNNLHYPATSGWDFASGFGTPNVPGVLQALQAFVTTKH